MFASHVFPIRQVIKVTPIGDVEIFCPSCDRRHRHNGSRGGHTSAHCTVSNISQQSGYYLTIPRRLLAQLPEYHRAGWRGWIV